jgi:two-component system, NtrC family, response regulator AtoC
MQRLRSRLRQLVDAEERMSDGHPPAVLIGGETGTGKELVARALHFEGPRRGGPFVEINCASLPAQLVESELFGHERGAFTDARERRIGLVEAAHGGTLFLDEVGELELATQAKLLKLLEDRQVRRLGSVREQKVDVRVLAATNRPLEAMVQAGQFRGDLFYRLGTLRIDLPPLREREGDAVLLAQAFLARSARRYGKAGCAFSEGALEALSRHRWPGNVRELGNLVEQCVILCSDPVIELEDLPLPVAPLSDFGGWNRDGGRRGVGQPARDRAAAARSRSRWPGPAGPAVPGSRPTGAAPSGPVWPPRPPGPGRPPSRQAQAQVQPLGRTVDAAPPAVEHRGQCTHQQLPPLGVGLARPAQGTAAKCPISMNSASAACSGICPGGSGRNAPA